MSEKSARGVSGRLLWDPHTGKHVLRVYSADKGFTDYRLAAQDIGVFIPDGCVSLYEEPEGNRLDWASKYLARGHGA